MQTTNHIGGVKMKLKDWEKAIERLTSQQHETYLDAIRNLNGWTAFSNEFGRSGLYTLQVMMENLNPKGDFDPQD